MYSIRFMNGAYHVFCKGRWVGATLTYVGAKLFIMDSIHDTDIYIYKRDNGKYIISHSIPNTNKKEYWGQYDTLEEAKDDRDLFECNNWDWSEIVEYDKGYYEQKRR